MATARNLDTTLNPIRVFYDKRYVVATTKLTQAKVVKDREVNNYGQFLRSIYTLYNSNSNDSEIFNDYNNRIINHLNSSDAFFRFQCEAYHDAYQMLLGAITRLNRATLNVTEPELRSQLSKACMNTLWLADSLIEKTIVAPNHLHKINALTNNLIAATAYAANPLGLREAEQLAKTTDVMIHRFQKSETLVLPEDRFASRYLSGMAMVLLTAAVITTMLLSTSLLPVAALLFISTAILPALLRLYVGSRAYYPEEGKAHCLRASLLGFFADKGLAQSAQALVPGPHFHRSYEQQAAYVPPPVRPGL